MQAGILRHRVIIQSPAPSDNPFQAADGWEDVVTMWAKISPATPKEIYYAQQQSMHLTHVITIRYPGKNFTVGAGYRLVYGNRVFNLEQGIINTDERNRELQLYAVEINPIVGGV